MLAIQLRELPWKGDVLQVEYHERLESRKESEALSGIWSSMIEPILTQAFRRSRSRRRCPWLLPTACPCLPIRLLTEYRHRYILWL